MKIFLLWDQTRLEKGESPELLDVFVSEEIAINHAILMFGFSAEDAGEHFTVEEREVRDKPIGTHA